jgi:hypothetical protein
LLVPETESGLEGNLSLADASEALDGGPLAVILVCAGRNSLKQLL